MYVLTSDDHSRVWLGYIKIQTLDFSTVNLLFYVSWNLHLKILKTFYLCSTLVLNLVLFLVKVL